MTLLTTPRLTTPRTSTRFTIVGLGVLALLTPASTAAASPPAGWKSPACDTVIGDGAFSFTADDGQTITSTSSKLEPQAYSHVAALRRRDSLVGTSKDSIQISRDAGCSWATIARTDNLSQYDVTAAGRDVAYVFGVNQQPIYRVADTRVRERSGPVDADGVTGLVADHRHPNKVTAVDHDGQIYRSSNGARSWRRVGKAPDVDIYRAAIDPADPDHVVMGTRSEGTYTTFDAGATWTRSRGIGKHAHANAFSVAISPADPMTVWAEGYNLDQSGNGARHIWRSVDGGLHYWPVLDGTDVTLYNGTSLWPSPVDPDVLYFEFGTWYGNYGTDLYRYDDARESVTSTHNNYDSIDSLAFSPADPTVMYLGLEEVQVSGI